MDYRRVHHSRLYRWVDDIPKSVLVCCGVKLRVMGSAFVNKMRYILWLTLSFSLITSSHSTCLTKDRKCHQTSENFWRSGRSCTNFKKGHAVNPAENSDFAHISHYSQCLISWGVVISVKCQIQLCISRRMRERQKGEENLRWVRSITSSTINHASLSSQSQWLKIKASSRSSPMPHSSSTSSSSQTLNHTVRDTTARAQSQFYSRSTKSQTRTPEMAELPSQREKPTVSKTAQILPGVSRAAVKPFLAIQAMFISNNFVVLADFSYGKQ